MPTIADDRTLVQHTGWAYFPIAFIARLPFAMMVVGVLTLVVAATGSVALGGLTSAAVGVGVVVAGPIVGDAVDRHGQRTVLVPVGLLNGVLLALFPIVVFTRMPEGMLLATAVLIGITAPQAAAIARRPGCCTDSWGSGPRCSATTMMLLASALTLAQALASAFTGAVAESVSVQAAMLIPGCAGVVVLLLGVANVAIEQRALARRVHAHA